MQLELFTAAHAKPTKNGKVCFGVNTIFSSFVILVNFVVQEPGFLLAASPLWALWG